MTEKEYDAFDMEIRKDLLNHADKFKHLIQLKRKLAQARMEQQRAFDAMWREDVAEIAELEAEIVQLKESAQQKMQIAALGSERRDFLGGMVTIQIRKNPGDYDEETLSQWASRFPYMWEIPEKKKASMDAFSKARDFLFHHAPEHLVLDEKTALRHAIETTPSGARRYPDAPVEIVSNPTNISDEKFEKVMYTVLLEEGITVDE